MTQVLELTPAELEIIKINREKEALAQAEKQAKNKAQIERGIVDCKAEIAKIIKAQDEQIAAATEYHKQLGKGWQLNIGENQFEKVVFDYGNKDENGAYKVAHRETHTKKEASIVNGGFTVRVKVQVVYNSKWDTRGTNNGWKMYLTGLGLDYKYENKAITKADTINKKIKEVRDEREAQTNATKKQVSVVEATVAKMQALYPGAEVVAIKEWRKEPYEKQGYEIDAVKIKMANGISSKWKVYPDGSLGRLEINFNTATSWETMDIINNIVKNN
jgi:hypothetical protein